MRHNSNMKHEHPKRTLTSESQKELADKSNKNLVNIVLICLTSQMKREIIKYLLNNYPRFHCRILFQVKNTSFDEVF